MIDVKALPIVDAFTSNGQPLVAILGPNHEVYWEAVKKMEGILPLIFESRKGGPLKEYKIYGNTPYQEWTPSPEKERTKNLLPPISEKNGWVKGFYVAFPDAIYKQGDIANQNETYKEWACKPIKFSDGVKYLSFKAEFYNENGWFGFCFFDENMDYISRPAYMFPNYALSGVSIPDNAAYVGFSARFYTNDVTELSNIILMLNEGSTALPYEPYGYREKTGPCEVKGVGEKNSVIPYPFYPPYINVPGTTEKTLYGLTYVGLSKEKVKIFGTPNTQIDLFLYGEYQKFNYNMGDSGTYYYNKTLDSQLFILYTSGSSQLVHVLNKNSGTFVIPNNHYINGCFYRIAPNIEYNQIFETYIYKESQRYKTTVVDEGKNLFSVDECTKEFVNTDGTVSSNNFYYLSEYYKVGTKISLSATKTSTDSFRIIKYDSNKKFISRVTLNEVNNVEITDCAYIRVNVNKDHWNVNTIMVNNGNPSPYTPYRPPIETTIYHDEPYFANDYIRKDKDGGVEHREWVKKRITEVFSATKLSNGLNRVAISLSPLAVLYSESRSYCNITGYNANYTIEGHVATSNTCYITLPIEELASVTTANKWFSEHEVYIWYKTQTPTDTPKDLPDIITVSGYNSIDTDTQIKPEKMEIAYR